MFSSSISQPSPEGEAGELTIASNDVDDVVVVAWCLVGRGIGRRCGSLWELLMKQHIRGTGLFICYFLVSSRGIDTCYRVTPF